jgi:hypothetical protein
MINTLIVGVDRMVHYEHMVSAYQGTDWAAVLGGIGNNPNNHQAFPAVSFANDNYSGWDSTKNWNEWHDNGSLNDSIQWIHGSHSSSSDIFTSICRFRSRRITRRVGPSPSIV